MLTKTALKMIERKEGVRHIPDELVSALNVLAEIDHPSVRDLLLKHGYAFEASQVERLVDMWKEYLHPDTSKPLFPPKENKS
jgi:hypothetical protein